ncbi:unnamed protein product [Trifolium pratense]|uniref:Uncharacterized protein n=1 Tax=Trifolium pratense TaxID=57577 RepID=A0ACB0K523_TRIPR|nr:unnamed protein product [Trifolium pratense]
MNNFDQALRDYRNNELVADFKSSSTDPVLSTQLPVIESHAGKIYTAELFKEVRHEILKAGELIVRDKSEVEVRKTYRLTKYFSFCLFRTIGVVPVKTEPFDAIWISSDDEGDNVAKGFAKRVDRRVDRNNDNNGANRVDKTADNNGAKRVGKTAVQNVAPKVVRVRKEKVVWITPVTKAMQKLRKKQTLHIPSWVVKHALLGKTEIYLRSAQTKHTYECAILNSGRSLQRYIGDGWYDYVDLHKPKVGDILQFSMNPPYDLIVVSLIR